MNRIRRTVRSGGFVTWALLPVLFLFAGNAIEAGTVALFASREAGQAVVDLAGVELSQQDGVVLLDRSRIEAVLAEQKLTAFGEKSDPLLLGHLLGVETFIVWDQPAAEPKGRLIVFDGATGCRLVDASLAAADIAQVATTLTQHVAAAAQKQQQLRNSQLRLFSITSQRNVSLPPDWQKHADQCLSELEGSIAQHPQCGLLERVRLRYVLREKSLPLAQQQAHLLAAAQTVTVELSRQDATHLGIKVIVHQAGPGSGPPQPGQVPPGQPMPPGPPSQADPALLLTVEKSIPVDANGPKVSQPALASIAESLATFEVKDTHQLSKEEHRQHEIATLMSDGHRLMSMRNCVEAATRFEAVYALDEEPSALNWLSIALRQGMSERSGSYGSMIPPPFEIYGLASIPPDRWFEVADLSHYWLDVQARIDARTRHLNKMWPFTSQPIEYPDALASEFENAYLIPVGTLPFVKRDALPMQYQALQTVYLRAYDHVFHQLANDGRRELQGDHLHRFNERLIGLELRVLGTDNAKHFIGNWADRYLEVCSENLQHFYWSGAGRSIAANLKDLSGPQRDLLFSRLDIVDTAANPDAAMGIQYLRLFAQAKDLTKRSPVFDSEWAELVERIAQEYVKPCEDPRFLQIRYMGYGMQIDTPDRRSTIASLLSATIQLNPNERTRQSKWEACFLKFLQNDIISVETIPYIIDSRSGNVSKETLEQAIKIVEAKEREESSPWKRLAVLLRNAQRASMTPMPNVPLEAQHLDMPWRRLHQIPLAEPGRRVTIHSTRVHKEYLYIVSSNEQPQGLKSGDLVLQVHRQSFPAKGAPERIASQEFARNTIDAGTLRVAQLLKRPLSGAGFFSEDRFKSSLAVSDQFLMFTTLADGVFVFPIAGGPRIRFGTDEGLPSNFVQSAVLLDDKVFAWVGAPSEGSSFVSMDIKSRKVQLLAACQRAQAQTPLDNMSGAVFSLIAPAANSQHLVMCVTGASDGKRLDPRNGIWEFHIPESTYKQIQVPLESLVGEVQGWNPVMLPITDLRTGKRDNTTVDPRTRQLMNQSTFYPISCSESVRWWLTEYGMQGVGVRQDLATGEITEHRIAVEGAINRTRLRLFRGEDTAIIQTDHLLYNNGVGRIDQRLWIATDFQLNLNSPP